MISCPARKADHTGALVAVVGGVQGRKAPSGAASTVSCFPLTVIRAPSMASTARTPTIAEILARSALVTPPGTEAMTSGTTRRVGVPPDRPEPDPAPGVPAPGLLGPAILADAGSAGDARAGQAAGHSSRRHAALVRQRVATATAAAERGDADGDGGGDRHNTAPGDGRQRSTANGR